MFRKDSASTLQVALLLACLLALVLLARGFAFDQAALDWAQTRRTYALDVAATLVTNLGSPLVVLGLAFVGSAALLTFRRRRLALFLLLNVLLVSGLNEGVKQLVQRPVVQLKPRPGPSLPIPTVLNRSIDIPTPKLPRTVYAFPSGHAAGSAALLLFLAFAARTGRWRWTVFVATTLLAVLVGVSRVYLGAHFPSDVLGGWALAAACFLGLRLLWPAAVSPRQRQNVSRK